MKSKYSGVFKVSLKQEFAYRLNFVMWRVRNIVQILLIYYLWDSVFSSPTRELFGYSRAKIITYIFGVYVLRAIVTSSRAQDTAGEIAQGGLTNYLLKPVSYFKYWFIRDLSSKALNLGFVGIEFSILFMLLKPVIFVPESLILVLLFIVSLVLAVLLYFFLLMVFSSFTFWAPEQAWGFVFLLSIFTDLFGGFVFPLDIFPMNIQTLLYATPFPYLVFAPLQIFLGKLSLSLAIRSVSISFVWVLVCMLILKKEWKLGLRAYRGEGR